MDAANIITIACALVVLSPCGFFLWKAVYLGMLPTKFHGLLTNTFCLRTDLKSHTGALQVSTDQTWQLQPEGPGRLHAQEAGGCHQYSGNITK